MVGTMAKIDDSVKKKVPELRFKGFTDEWEERKLKDIAQFNPKTVLPDEFEYVDLESVVGTEMISHRTESKDQAPSRAQRLAQKGDVFYQTVRPYQMNNYLYDLPYDNYVFSTGYAQMRPNIDSYFLLNSVQNKQFVQHVLDRSTGTSYPAINSSDLSNIEIHVPSKLSEQQKIGAFFQSIDDTIALHQRKLDLLKEQKKGYLQKMFPKNGAKVPELRFAGFADDWEERKLTDVTSSYSGLTYSPTDVQDKGTFVLRSSNVKNDQLVDADNVYVNPDIVNSNNVKVGDVIVVVRNGSRSLIGKHAIVIKEMPNTVIGAFMSAFRGQNGDYINALLSTNNFQKEVHKSLGATINQITGKDFSMMNFLTPKLEEQSKIGSFFKQLDETIALHQRKLDLLKEQKKGFLQKMFVWGL
ncbi:restriction endonuclease subunit S (plasmid) [Levilactobacillus brevis]|nr:restriction endonuclease subunit S [Levilactobacillus brevis]